MEVTPHLKSVLKNYQHSATKSLQGPGYTLTISPTGIKSEPSPTDSSTGGGDLKEDEFVLPPFPVQQVPILTTPDTSCSERSETILEGERISCFIIGGEKRLCLPLVLNSVLREFSLNQINQECDHLQIYCSRCTPEQLNVLKNERIIPVTAPSCGLIKKTDAERLCSALLHGQQSHNANGSQGQGPFWPRDGFFSFPVYHECFGEANGVCYPELYVNKQAKCIKCQDCKCGFTPQQFVCHVHKNLENRTVHWGFDSSNWRNYIRIPKDHIDKKQFEKYLDEMQEQYENKIPFPSTIVETAIKRKQMLSADLMKEPLKKQKIEEYFNNLPFNNSCIQQLYANLEPIYNIQQCLQEFSTQNRHLSAFKPVSQSIKESKLRQASALGIATSSTGNTTTIPPSTYDSPVLQNSDRVIHIAENNRFERGYQPNVALAPKKHHRYGRSSETSSTTNQQPIKTENGNAVLEKINGVRNGACLKNEKIDTTSQVSVVITPKYNPEIELSTDTEDSASEADNSKLCRIEDLLNSVTDKTVRDKILEIFQQLSEENNRLLKECQNKDRKISELMEQKNNLEEEKQKNRDAEVDNSHTDISISKNSSEDVKSDLTVSTDQECSNNFNNNNNIIDNDSENCSSIIKSKSDCINNNNNSSNNNNFIGENDKGNHSDINDILDIKETLTPAASPIVPQQTIIGNTQQATSVIAALEDVESQAIKKTAAE